MTDFGMSKLMDMNPRMTPLTQVPGTPAYMPPEALIASPQYSSKLDCFSCGVLTLQIITRNFPNPGEATRYVDDPRYPTGRVSIHYPETERRKKDIDLIEPSHPLRPIALHCLKDRDTERPSADELCGRLASLKREPRYTHSVEQTRGHIQRLQDELEREKAEHHEQFRREISLQEQLRRERALQERLRRQSAALQEQLQRERAALQEQLQREQLLVRNLQEEVDTLKHSPRDEGTEIASNLEELVSYRTYIYIFAREGKWDAQPMHFFQFFQNNSFEGGGGEGGGGGGSKHCQDRKKWSFHHFNHFHHA